MPSKEDESLRVIVAVTRSGHPELFDELAKIPAKYRAERLRTMGLITLRGSSLPVGITGMQALNATQVPSEKASQAAAHVEDAAERELEKRRLAMKDSIKMSL
ncbi:MAG: hypothetical protein GX771_04215 [Halomonadaceae bacterium]|nr:hypothetical protein [Halomonadaceae bacterium]